MRFSGIIGLIGLVALAGCGDHGSARQVLGLTREAPDAFAVSTHAPLAVPQNLDTQLPAPQPGMARPQEVSPQSMAQNAMFATGTTAPATAPSAAEQALLQQAGPAEANVRTEVNREAARDAAAVSGPLDWVVFWRSKPQPGLAVDAKAEADRIARARAMGEPVTEGATPVLVESGRLRAPEEIK